MPILGDSGRLQVVDTPGGQTLRVTAVRPLVSYPDGPTPSRRYSISVLGDGFSRVGANNKVLFNGKEIPICWDGDPTCSADTTKAAGSAIGTHQLDLQLPESYQGAQDVQIRVGENISVAEHVVRATLARVSRGAPIWIAAIVVGLLILLVVYLLGVAKSSYTVDGVRLSRLSALFLDKATDTYSLSRAQFYAWTAAAAAGTRAAVSWT